MIGPLFALGLAVKNPGIMAASIALKSLNERDEDDREETKVKDERRRPYEPPSWKDDYRNTLR